MNRSEAIKRAIKATREAEEASMNGCEKRCRRLIAISEEWRAIADALPSENATGVQRRSIKEST